ncbi:MAG: ATP-binding protein [Pseudohongiellaceae bacterium]
MSSKATQYDLQMVNVALVYNVYRIVLPLIFLATYVISPNATYLGALDPVLFVQVCTGYAIFGVLLAFVSRSTQKLLQRQTLTAPVLVIDILAITLLVYSCGGIGSGLGLLLIVNVAAGSILIRGRISTFLAAVAALSVIYCETFIWFYLSDPPNQFLQAGLLGTILFATSFYIQAVSDRIYRSAVLADQQASDIVDLEQLNKLIIHKIKTGILVVNQDGQVITSNSAANSILRTILKQVDATEMTIDKLPLLLMNKLDQWKQLPGKSISPFVIPGSTMQILASFAYLNPQVDSDILIFLEDHLQIAQRVRQTKLASLGRLTASIAHEIRNPLGVLSHASQLLKESEEISDGDRRMVDIVLQHSKRVNSIVENVLDASRHKDILPERLVLKDWLKKFIATYQTSHNTCDEIRLTVEPEDIEVVIIGSQMEQVLNNLFENGLRYSQRATGKATLLLRGGLSSEQGETRPFLHIVDEGPGIEESVESQLFEPFYTTEQEGTGLGLYISRELCDANNAQLVYGHTGGGKSCFSIYFTSPAVPSP